MSDLTPEKIDERMRPWDGYQRKRTRVVPLYFTDEEFAEVSAEAEAGGLRVTQHIRSVVLKDARRKR